MGKSKKSKEHRKKVQARNARVAQRHKQLGQELEKLKQEQILAAAKEKTLIKNYARIHEQLQEDKKQEILEQSLVRFSS